MTNDDPFADFDEATTSQPIAPAPAAPREHREYRDHDRQDRNGDRNSNGGFADEIFSRKIEARNRTFFIDLKQSPQGKFLKISERSRGKKSTIIMDAEDISGFVDTLEEVRKVL